MFIGLFRANPLLTKMAMQLRDDMRLYGIDSREGLNRQRASVQEHAQMVGLAEKMEVDKIGARTARLVHPVCHIAGMGERRPAKDGMGLSDGLLGGDVNRVDRAGSPDGWRPADRPAFRGSWHCRELLSRALRIPGRDDGAAFLTGFSSLRLFLGSDAPMLRNAADPALQVQKRCAHAAIHDRHDECRLQ